MFQVFGRTGPPTLGQIRGPLFWSLKILYKLTFVLLLIEMLQQMRFASIQCSKMRLQPGICGSSAPDTAGGAYSAAPDSLAGFKGPLPAGRGKGGKGKEGERGREGEEGEGMGG